ncbi:MAG: hypothetical protein NW205_11020 [Hyphomicrobiaceae bacterium]|nr:hypothetical protein [Hyphomicrobiaceae bacterium]
MTVIARRSPLATAVALALLSSASPVALAGGDWPGSTKDYVPVPAPAPIPVYEAKYYFRADAGIGLGDGPGANEHGLLYGQDSRSGPFGTSPAWLNSDFETFVTLGVGVGYYWTDRVRMDLTAETRSEGKVKINGSYTYRTEADGIGDYDQVRGTVRDETTLHGGLFLLNGYYDFKRDQMQAFVPYVGGGVGFVWNELKRNHSTNERSRTCTTSIQPQCAGAFSTDFTEIEQDKTNSITFAAAATAGFSYQWTDSILMDFNYRFLYLGGSDAGLQVANRFGGATRVDIEDQYEHQLRAGLRFEVE